MSGLKPSDKIFVAGHRGLVGSAILRALKARGFEHVIVRTRGELDLENQAAVRSFLAAESLDWVIDCAALVGGIEANRSRPADFIGRNLGIQQNLIWGAFEAGIENFCFLGSSCIYPRDADQPMAEDAVLTGSLEPTNAPYAIAKIAGMTLCESIWRQYGRNYFTVMPPNIYGENDNFDPEGSHVMAAMIRRFHEALPHKDVTCWGSGSPRREFLYVDDAADAILFLCESDLSWRTVNIGTGVSVSVKELAETVQSVVGHTGSIGWDTTRPDGYPEKTNDVSRLTGLGWSPTVGLEEGIRRTYRWYLENIEALR